MSTPLEATLKSLELLQGIINRLSGHSFLIKGWAVTLVVGLLTFSGSTGQGRLAWLAVLPIVMFWMVDGFLLARERDYRQRFDALRRGQAEPFDFQLPALTSWTWLQSAFSGTLGIFYGFLLLLALVIIRSVP